MIDIRKLFDRALDLLELATEEEYLKTKKKSENAGEKKRGVRERNGGGENKILECVLSNALQRPATDTFSMPMRVYPRAYPLRRARCTPHNTHRATPSLVSHTYLSHPVYVLSFRPTRPPFAHLRVTASASENSR